MKPANSSLAPVLRKISIALLLVAGALAAGAAEARGHVAVNIGISGVYGGGYWHGGGYRSHGYYGGYRPYYYGPSWNVYLPIVSVLPFGYSTVWVEGEPYYYADNVYYQRVPSGFRVVPAPSSNEVTIQEAPAAAQPSVPAQNPSAPVPSYANPAPAVDSNQLYAYPRNGQTPTQTTFDRIECERWASSQTGFNPGQSREDGQRRSDYQRATGACLEGRGYTVK
jgi:hypothetical protein